MTSGRGEPRTRRAVHGRDLTVGQPGQKPDRRPEGHRQTPKGTQTAPQPDPQPQHNSQAPKKDARRHTKRRRTPQTSQREGGTTKNSGRATPGPAPQAAAARRTQNGEAVRGSGDARTTAQRPPKPRHNPGRRPAKGSVAQRASRTQGKAPPVTPGWDSSRARRRPTRITEPRTTKNNNTARGGANREARPILPKARQRGNREAAGPEATDGPNQTTHRKRPPTTRRKGWVGPTAPHPARGTPRCANPCKRAQKSATATTCACAQGPRPGATAEPEPPWRRDAARSVNRPRSTALSAARATTSHTLIVAGPTSRGLPAMASLTVVSRS